MTIYFATLMGKIKELEVELHQNTTKIDQNCLNYLNTSNQIITTSEQILQFIATQKLNETNLNEIKDQYKTSVLIFKQELEQPLKLFEKKMQALAKVLSKLTEKINYSHAENSDNNPECNVKQMKKYILNSAQIDTLSELIQKLHEKICSYQKILAPILEKSELIKYNLNSIKVNLDADTINQKQLKLTEDLNAFNTKLQSVSMIDNHDYSKILIALKTTENLIYDLIMCNNSENIADYFDPTIASPAILSKYDLAKNNYSKLNVINKVKECNDVAEHQESIDILEENSFDSNLVSSSLKIS